MGVKKNYLFADRTSSLYLDRTRVFLSKAATACLVALGYEFSDIPDTTPRKRNTDKPKPPSRVSVFLIHTPDGRDLLVENIMKWISEEFPNQNARWVYVQATKKGKYNGYSFTRTGYRTMRSEGRK